jgi:hypothetical protein
MFIFVGKSHNLSTLLMWQALAYTFAKLHWRNNVFLVELMVAKLTKKLAVCVVLNTLVIEMLYASKWPTSSLTFMWRIENMYELICEELYTGIIKKYIQELQRRVLIICIISSVCLTLYIPNSRNLTDPLTRHHNKIPTEKG